MNTQKITFEIISTQHDISEESTRTLYTGKYAFLAGKHVITYDEYFESEGETPSKSSSIIKIGKNSLDIHKKGTISTKMHFESGQKHVDTYLTPYGNFHMEIDTHCLETYVNPTNIGASVTYSLSLNGSPVSKCSVKLRILSRE